MGHADTTIWKAKPGNGIQTLTSWYIDFHWPYRNEQTTTRCHTRDHTHSQK